MIYMTIRDLLSPSYEQDPDEVSRQLISDIETFRALRSTRYISPRIPIKKCGSILLAFQYAQDGNMRPRFAECCAANLEALRFCAHSSRITLSSRINQTANPSWYSAWSHFVSHEPLWECLYYYQWCCGWYRMQHKILTCSRVVTLALHKCFHDRRGGLRLSF